MDINEYTVNTDFGAPNAGLISFQGKTYTPSEIQEFADALTALADEAEGYIPEEETREYKENQAYYERQNYEAYKRLLLETPISQYIKVWEGDMDSGIENGEDMWRAQDGDRRTLLLAAMKEYEEKNLNR